VEPLPALTVVQAPLADLHAHPGNPRTIRPERLEQLKRTLQAERGMLDARPLIALPDGTVIAGNQRLAAAAALGWDTIPTVYADLDAEQRTRWMLLDNRPFGEDDETAVAVLLAELEQAGSDLDLTGYTSADADRMMRALTASERDPDDAPPAPAEPKSVRGEVYALGAHRVMCGDATDIADIAALLQGEKADVLLTDPPYGVLYKSSKKNAIQGDLSQATIPISFAVAIDHALNDDARLYLFGGSGNWTMYAKLFDYHLQMEPRPIVWVKEAFVMRPNGYHSQFEMVYHGWKGSGGGPEFWFGDRKSSDVWHVSREREHLHPTQKPVDALALPIVNSCPSSGLVFDPFGGSGATLIAAEMHKRRCFTIELDERYVDVIRQRYADYTGQPEYAP
jgi:DNA modification methylase